MKKKILNLIKKKNKSKIVSLTAYSKNIASILDNFCDLILVGDSLGSVLYNYKSTRDVTLKMMIEHSKSVRMGIKKSLMCYKNFYQWDLLISLRGILIGFVFGTVMSKIFIKPTSTIELE